MVSFILSVFLDILVLAKDLGIPEVLPSLTLLTEALFFFKSKAEEADMAHKTNCFVRNEFPGNNCLCRGN